MIDVNFSVLEAIGTAYQNHSEFLDLALRIFEEFLRELSDYTTIRITR